MEFHRHRNDEVHVIKAFGPEGVRVGEQTFQRSCVISPLKLIDDWPVGAVDALTTMQIDLLLELEPEVVILGSGISLQFPPPQTGAYFTNRGIGFEVMDSAAACRTYNVLVHEGRNVAVALIIAATGRSSSVE